MLSIPGRVKIFLAVEPADMRQGFDRLAARVSQTLQADPLSGHLFVFRNRRADRLKLLYWDGDGYAIWYKKFKAEDTQIFVFTEAGRFAHNRHVGIAEARRMVGISRQSSSRR
jgi:hypothetical protein